MVLIVIPMVLLVLGVWNIFSFLLYKYEPKWDCDSPNMLNKLAAHFLVDLLRKNFYTRQTSLANTYTVRIERNDIKGEKNKLNIPLLLFGMKA